MNHKALTKNRNCCRGGSCYLVWFIIAPLERFNFFFRFASLCSRKCFPLLAKSPATGFSDFPNPSWGVRLQKTFFHHRIACPLSRVTPAQHLCTGGERLIIYLPQHSSHRLFHFFYHIVHLG